MYKKTIKNKSRFYKNKIIVPNLLKRGKKLVKSKRTGNQKQIGGGERKDLITCLNKTGKYIQKGSYKKIYNVNCADEIWKKENVPDFIPKCEGSAILFSSESSDKFYKEIELQDKLNSPELYLYGECRDGGEIERNFAIACEKKEKINLKLEQLQKDRLKLETTLSNEEANLSKEEARLASEDNMFAGFDFEGNQFEDNKNSVNDLRNLIDKRKEKLKSIEANIQITNNELKEVERTPHSRYYKIEKNFSMDLLTYIVERLKEIPTKDGRDGNLLEYMISRFPSYKTNFKILLYKLRDMHTKNIGHFDIKSENILVDVDEGTKNITANALTDYGYTAFSPYIWNVSGSSQAYKETAAKPAAKPTEIILNLPGTPGYTDPIALLTGQLDLKSDIFSLGIVLFESYFGNSVVFAPGPNINVNTSKYTDWMKQNISILPKAIETVDAWKDRFFHYCKEHAYYKEDILDAIRSVDNSKEFIDNFMDLIYNMLLVTEYGNGGDGNGGDTNSSNRYNINQVISHPFWYFEDQDLCRTAINDTTERADKLLHDLDLSNHIDPLTNETLEEFILNVGWYSFIDKNKLMQDRNNILEKLVVLVNEEVVKMQEMVAKLLAKLTPATLAIHEKVLAKRAELVAHLENQEHYLRNVHNPPFITKSRGGGNLQFKRSKKSTNKKNKNKRKIKEK